MAAAVKLAASATWIGSVVADGDGLGCGAGLRQRPPSFAADAVALRSQMAWSVLPRRARRRGPAAASRRRRRRYQSKRLRSRAEKPR